MDSQAGPAVLAISSVSDLAAAARKQMALAMEAGAEQSIHLNWQIIARCAQELADAEGVGPVVRQVEAIGAEAAGEWRECTDLLHKRGKMAVAVFVVMHLATWAALLGALWHR